MTTSHPVPAASDHGRDRQAGPCLPGNLVERTTRCGSPRCRCHNNPSHRHGPYPSWVRKIGERTITHTLSPAQAERYRPMFDNASRLRQLVSELETVSAQLIEELKDGRPSQP